MNDLTMSGGLDTPAQVHVDNAVALEEYLQFPDWLAEHEPRLHRLLYVADLAQATALDDAGALTRQLKLPEIVKQLERLARDLHEDLPAAIGHSKDLVESACKSVLGQTGAGAGGKGPALVAAALAGIDRSPAQLDPTDPDAQLLKQLLGATSSQLQGVFGLRNRFGIGHGRAGEIVIDEPLARLVIGQALHAVTYLLRVHAQQTAQPQQAPGLPG